MSYQKTTFLVLGLGFFLTATFWAQTSSAGAGQQKDQTQAYGDLMRKNLRTEKQSIVDQAMELEAADKPKFWAVYEKYQTELKGIWDQRLANIKKYAENYNNMTDAVADQLATTALNIEDRNRARYRACHSRAAPNLHGRFVARKE